MVALDRLLAYLIHHRRPRSARPRPPARLPTSPSRASRRSAAIVLDHAGLWPRGGGSRPAPPPRPVLARICACSNPPVPCLGAGSGPQIPDSRLLHADLPAPPNPAGMTWSGWRAPLAGRCLGRAPCGGGVGSRTSGSTRTTSSRRRRGESGSQRQQQQRRRRLEGEGGGAGGGHEAVRVEEFVVTKRKARCPSTQRRALPLAHQAMEGAAHRRPLQPQVSITKWLDPSGHIPCKCCTYKYYVRG
ncbi:unnamed protein product [Urochloa humidicola]